MRKIELLSPARDLLIGKAAIDYGADAVYIGASAFGARKEAGNELADIEELVRYAHRFYARVYVTLNTVLYDSELAEAERLIHRLYEIGTDALIIQDPGIFKLDIPPIALHASTQMHNYDLERIKFLDQLGIQRIVLARELSLEQIKQIRQEVKAELEVFIHGALCVSLSGQCYMSQYMFGRSANRGECAQACRMRWSVKDENSKQLLKDKYILSLKDLNMSAYINDLIDIGVDSFKIEGRLKDANYVSNVTSYYNSLISSGIKNKEASYKRLASGSVQTDFVPDPERSFNRGFTDYFAQGRRSGLVNMDTPKSLGKRIGIVKQIQKTVLKIEAEEVVHNGDGLCYLSSGVLKGIRVNIADGDRLECNEIPEIRPGTVLYRNYDHQFAQLIEKSDTRRKIGMQIRVNTRAGHLILEAEDEDGVTVEIVSEECFECAQKPEQQERLCQQLMKCGDTDFICRSVNYEGKEVLFIPSAVINGYRRRLLELLAESREQQRPAVGQGKIDPDLYYKSDIDWHYNVVNEKSALFYREHGAGQVEAGFEVSPENSAQELMRTRYCLLYELGRCRKQQANRDLLFPLYLYNDKYCFQLEFDCKQCFMKIGVRNRREEHE